MTETTTKLECVYYFPIDAQGHEKEALPITLAADGQADLSHLPQNMREALETFGAPDEFHDARLYAEHGEEFLFACLRLNNGYIRFRTTADKRY